MRTILMADDDRISANLLAKILRSSGYNVVYAYDGCDALSGTKRVLPDIVILDIDMPRMDGLAVLAAIRHDPTTRGLPVILFSGHAGAFSPEALEDATDYWVKGEIPVAEMLQRLESVLIHRDGNDAHGLRAARASS